MSKPEPIRLHPMHERPEPGRKIVVLMRDGMQLDDCHTTMIVAQDMAGIIIYHRGKAIDESMAKGWWPIPKGLDSFKN